MGNLTLRSVKGSALTHTELDNNFGYFTGSHAITGSLTASDGFVGNVVGTASYATLAVTASYAISASYATTSSYVKNAQTASYVANAVSASYSTTSSYVEIASRIPTVAYVPTSSADEGTIVGSWAGSAYSLYVYIGGGWRKFESTP